MKAKAKTAAAVAAATIMGAGAARAVPAVYDVTMAQIEYTRQVRVTYKLTNANAIVTLSIETNGVAIPDSAVTRLSGDVCREIAADVSATREIIWNAGADWPEHEVDNAKARVTAWSVDAPPQVMVIDLTPGPTAATYPVYYYTSAEALPHGGLTNSIYKNTRLVMRKLLAGAFAMGEGTPVEVTLTNDFYAGVFPVTQGQWFNVMGSGRTAYFTDASSRAFRPMEQVSYFDIRENPVNSAISPNWPQTDAVHADSFMGKLRVKTGNINGFDLPTEAQWEYACRAGTTTYYNDGIGTPANTTSNAQMNVLGRYEQNGGKVWDGSAWVNPAAACDAANGTAIVGSYAPNAWGLYDTHGNVWEWCLDWHASALTGGTDPKGADSGSYRVFRGGSWNNSASNCRSACRNFNVPSYRYCNLGFRLVRTLP